MYVYVCYKTLLWHPIDIERLSIAVFEGVRRFCAIQFKGSGYGLGHSAITYKMVSNILFVSCA
jgi:hypothetical protein